MLGQDSLVLLVVLQVAARLHLSVALLLSARAGHHVVKVDAAMDAECLVRQLERRIPFAKLFVPLVDALDGRLHSANTFNPEITKIKPPHGQPGAGWRHGARVAEEGHQRRPDRQPAA